MIRRPRTLWLPAAILAALVPAFAGLGLWQLHRAGEKHALQAEYDQRTGEAPRRLAGTPADVTELRYRRVRVRGVYDSEHQILIDNRVQRGVPGYHVITPLRIEGGEMRVLVNRGWVPLGASREVLPPVDAPTGPQEIAGVVTVPAEKVFTLGDTGPGTSGWTPVWNHLDLRRYAAAVPFMVQPLVVLLDADAAHGYTREWSRLDAGIALHRGYAVQWFALAGLSLVIMALVLRRAWRGRREALA